MAIRRFPWGPDTCATAWDADWDPCEIVFEYDDSLPLIDVVITVAQVNRLCPIHAALAGPDAGNQVWAENRIKNDVMGLLEAERADVTPPDYEWSYDDARVLQASFPGVALSIAAKQLLQDACDLQFGPGKVVVS